MNDLERRALLGAAGVGALAALAARSKGGPLNPPAGPVAPTGRTLDEVYNRIPDFAATQLDGRTPIGQDGGQGGVTITAPGSYLLVRDITSTGTTLHISANDVSIDLNGFTVTSTSTQPAAVIFLNGNRSRVRVRNGAVAGIGTGILTGSLSNGLVIENVSFSGLRIGIGSTNVARGALIRNCSFVDMGSGTTAADTAATIAGIDITAIASRIEECTVSRLFYNGTGTPAFHGIRATGAGNLVSRCLVTDDGAITGTGILMSSSGTYRDNTVINFSTPYSGGVAGTGNL
ncbi:MAG TPA: hypothetical protein VEB22_10305 [Phycisphaerales bacterium]|nr:hypothetical protein [Phycisphaerales bacterium]